MKPIAFKVRGGGNYSGTKGGAVKPNEKGGAGYLGYEDKTFTIATSPDQWICTTINKLSSQPIPMNEPAKPAPLGKPLRYLSVCSGMEAASVAWHPLGWTPVGFSEIEPFPCAILKHRFPNVPNYGDLTQYQQWPLSTGDVDLIAGGPPCQAFSVAGLRRGLADPRGNLTLTYLGLVDKLRPKWVVYENVPGLLSVDGGRAAGSFLGALGQLGYGWAYRVLDAQYVGRCEMHPQGRGWDAVPQRRRRIFLVACLGDWRAPAEVLSLREGLRGYLEAGGKKRKSPAADAGSGVEAGCWWDGGQVSQTLDAVLQKGQTMPEKNRFPAVLQPVSHWQGSDIHPTLNQSAKGSGGVGASNQELFSQGGAYLVPGQPTPFRKSKRACSTTDNETWVPADVTNTLNNFDLGDTRTTHAVVNSVAPTVTSSGPPYSRTGNERVEAEALAITFQPGNLRREAGAEPSTTTTTTLKASAGDQTPHVAYSQGVDLYNQTLTGDLHVPLRTAGGHGAPATLQAMAVRRLTPNECYRLQGFPDNWGRIPWKGKPAEECPDGPQYKACGNSMAVPCMFWIGERIARVELSTHA